MEVNVKSIIGEFFEGKTHWSRIEDTEKSRAIAKLGHFWIARHDNFETLTFEPVTGGQYEIAVRAFSEADQEWQGYKINDPEKAEETFFVGVNTRGH